MVDLKLHLKMRFKFHFKKQLNMHNKVMEVINSTLYLIGHLKVYLPV